MVVHFKSKQFNFLMSSLENKGNDVPAPNWTIEWTGINISVYAINNENYIYFANYDDYFLEFDGWQIIKAIGFLPNQTVAGIKPVDNNLTYFLNEKAIATVICENWSVSTNNTENSVVYKQICNVSGNTANYTNVMIINDDEQIIGLKYKIHPSYPSIQLRMNNYLDIEL